MQNIKVDIVYYMSNTDFEMEFNLCGCCRMRLLTDKAGSKKELLAALSKAVDRSRVIIACGNLFGEDGLTNTVATALGAELIAVNNETYGIDSKEKVEIIAGATPLVTPEGAFGGFIIESGPQSIILLTENKGVRKVLMNNLVHKYIEDLSLIPVETVSEPQPETDTKEEQTENTPAEAEETEQTKAENTDTPAEDISEETAEETVEETAEEPKAEEVPEKEEHNISFVDKNGEALESEEAQLYINPKKAKREKSSYYEYYVPSEDNERFLAGSQYGDKTRRKSAKSTRSLNVPIIILLCLLLIIVLAAAYFLIGIPLLKGEDIVSYVSNIFAESSSVI